MDFHQLSGNARSTGDARDLSGAPFLIMALPRSRTTWLTRYLSYGPWICWHDQARYLREPADIQRWFLQPYTGSAETSVARWWRLIRLLQPELRIVVVRRPVEAVVDSLLRLDLGDAGTFDRDRLRREMLRLDRALDQIEARLSPLTVSYSDLAGEVTCKAVFEFCLGLPHDHAWWQALAPINLQTDMRGMMRYVAAFSPHIALGGKRCLVALKRLRRPAKPIMVRSFEDGIDVYEEPLSVFWRDAQDLFREHCKAVGEPEDQFLRKNLPLIQRIADAGGCQILTVRCNGRMLGYLASVIAPSLEEVRLITATQTLAFVTKDAPSEKNLMIRMQRASIEEMKARGVGEIYMRAGIRGDGPRMDVVYRRLGAKEFGSLYKLTLHGGISPSE